MSKTVEELQKELETLQAENEKLSKAINSNTVSNKVPGVYKHDSGNYSFVDGALLTRLEEGSAVPSSELIKIASKSDYKPSNETLKSYPALLDVTHERAKTRLDFLIQVKYALFVKIK